MEGPTEFYSSRIPKKQRKNNLVDQLLGNGTEKINARIQALRAEERRQKQVQYKI